jgi:Peptidase A4 family
MPHRRTPRRLGRALVCCALLSGALASLPAVAEAAAVSTNWAGYVASPRAAARFSGVSGVWRVPRVDCSARRESFSAIWVGLGGYSESASSLEQAGSEADCSRGGRASYAAWYELLPEVARRVPISVRPGDQLAASVTVRGRRVTLRLRDITSGARLSVTRAVSTLDVSTAEWIVEAPSTCSDTGRCRTLPLADYGEVSFAGATATAGGHTGPVADTAWRAGALELRQGALQPGFSGAAGQPSVIVAAPSPLSAVGAFTVGWRLVSDQEPPPNAPTLPGG